MFLFMSAGIYVMSEGKNKKYGMKRHKNKYHHYKIRKLIYLYQILMERIKSHSSDVLRK